MTPQLRMAALVRCLRGCNPQWSRTEAKVHTARKVCTSCGGDPKPIGDFYLKVNLRNGSKYRDGQCKKCRIAKVIARKAA